MDKPQPLSITPAWRRWLWPVACTLVLAVLPLLTENRFYIHLGNLIFLNVLLAVGLGIITKAGQLSLCHAAFAGLGAYGSALLAMNFGLPPALTLVAGALLAAAVALPVGIVILRLRGVYFVLVTFLLGQIFHLLMLDFADLTRGASGLVGIPSIRIMGHSFGAPRDFYWLALFITALVLLFVSALLRSPVGRAFSSIDENIVLAEASGIDTRRYQVLAFTLGSGIAGLSGGLFAHYIHLVSPDTFTFWESVGAIVMVVVGGKASLVGWVLGAAFITPLPELLRNARELQYVLYGAILIGVLLFLPGGLASIRTRLQGRA